MICCKKEHKKIGGGEHKKCVYNIYNIRSCVIKCVLGLLMVTCTDVAILCGNGIEACHAKYGAVSTKIASCHELVSTNSLSYEIYYVRQFQSFCFVNSCTWNKLPLCSHSLFCLKFYCLGFLTLSQVGNKVVQVVQ